MQDLRAHPLHHVLTALALSVGTLAIVCTVVAGEVAHDVFVAKEEQRTAKSVTFRADIADAAQKGIPAAVRDHVVEDLRAAGGAAAFVADTAVSVQVGAATPSPSTVQAYTGDYPSVRRLPLLAGRWPAGESLPADIVANAGAGRHVGDTVLLRSAGHRPALTAVVVAVVADGDPQAHYYLPWSECDDFLPCGIATASLFLHGAMSKDAIDAYLRRDDHLAGAVVDRYDTAGSLQDQLEALQVVFTVCGAVALIVSCAGMMNLGLAGIRHRSRELAVRRAIGARRSDILLLVLGSAVAVGLVGAGLAVGTAWLLTTIVLPGLLDPAAGVEPPPFPVAAMLWGIGVGVATSLLGAAAPAVVAARVEISSVLRA